jgi:hypothetical protein
MNWNIAIRVFLDILIRDIEKGINVYIFEDSEIKKYIKSPSDKNEKDNFEYVTEVEEVPPIKEQVQEDFPIYYMNKRI